MGQNNDVIWEVGAKETIMTFCIILTIMLILMWLMRVPRQLYWHAIYTDVNIYYIYIYI